MTNERRRKFNLRCETAEWQKAAAGIFAVSLAVNMAQMAYINRLNRDRIELADQVQTAEHIRDMAVQELGAVSLASVKEKQERAEQAAAYEAIGSWEYIGKFTLTAYCPCAECCGKWADGVTATGLPAVPGIVAVDPEVIPMGSTIIIDGQKYLAADTGSGITGNHIDICMSTHDETVEFGVQTATVWWNRDEKRY